MILTQRDNGSTIMIGIGDIVSLRLSENPTTGYRWHLESLYGFKQIKDDNETEAGIGAGGARVIDLQAKKVGSYSVRLKKWRNWEGESSIIDRFNVTVIVK